MQRRWIASTLLFLVMMSQTAAAIEIGKLLELPEKRIDIGIAALTFAKEFYPDLDVAAYSKRIDLLAARAKVLTKGTTDPEERIRGLNTFLFKIEGYSYDRTRGAENRLGNRFLNGIQDSKKGTCVNMPILYLAIAQRLGYPVYPVAAPDHLFLRYIDPKLEKQNIETTSGGGYSSDEAYIRDFKISKKGIRNGAYLRTMTYRQFLADLLGENAVNLAMRGDLDKAIRYFEKAIALNPKFPDYYDQLRVIYLLKSRQAKDEQRFLYLEKAQKYFIKAEALGLVAKHK